VNRNARIIWSSRAGLALSGSAASVRASAHMLAPVMLDSSVTYQPVSIADTATILRLSESSVRRLVEAGCLGAERVQPPQQHVWLVKAPARATEHVKQPPRRVGASGDAPAADGQAPLAAACATRR